MYQKVVMKNSITKVKGCPRLPVHPFPIKCVPNIFISPHKYPVMSGPKFSTVNKFIQVWPRARVCIILIQK